MPVIKTCKQCGIKFSRPPSIAKRSVFCGKECYDTYQTTSEIRTIPCERCGKKFRTKRDHGKWPRFCSWRCFAPNPDIERNCEYCGEKFKSSWNHDAGQYKRFCSPDCYAKSSMDRIEKVCVNCGNLFETIPSREDKSCCSWECRNEYYTDERGTNYKDGTHIHSEGGYKMLLFKRDGYVGSYMAEHRVVAQKALGRKIEPHEIVFWLNGIRGDNRVENLYICKDRTEYNKIRLGSLPFPKTSNILGTY